MKNASFPNKIHRLDSRTIDQIAAGEVIDGPYSCIKELIDNAIDANATNIVIEIAVGGREWLKVTDDGSGMSSDDLLLSVERHATSKITYVSDLDSLITMGFRGEALSSIGSVSHMSITSCLKDPDSTTTIGIGAQIVIHGGEKISFQKDVQTNFGTSIEVRSLFYNLPARRKFMKSPAKDTQEIYKSIQHLALAHPNISFRFVSDKILKASFSSGRGEYTEKLFQRIRDVIGEDIANHGVFFESRISSKAYLRGFLGFPTTARSSRSCQYLIVNGRPVHSIPFSYAVKSGYATSIGKDEHPVFVLSLEIDPEEIDVNVHPQKKEIRFREEEVLRKAIESIIAQELFSRCNMAENDFSKDRVPLPFLSDTSDVQADEIATESTFTRDSNEGNDTFPSFSSFPSQPFKREAFRSFDEAPSRLPNPFISRPEKSFSYTLEPAGDELLQFPTRSIEKNSNTGSEKGTDNERPLIVPLARCKEFHPILVIPKGDSFCSSPLILHFENACKAVYIFQELERKKSTSQSQSETLLVPHLLRVVKDQAKILEEKIGELEALGFSLRPFGNDTFMVEAVPQGAIAGKIDIDSFFKNWLFKQENVEDEASLYEGALQDISLGGVVYTKEDLSKAYIKASLLLKSFQIHHAQGTVSSEFMEYIVQEWIKRGRPHAALSGERIFVEVDSGMIESLFIREKKSRYVQ